MGGGGAGGLEPPIGLWSVQNRMLFVLLRPIWCEKWKIAPPIRKQPPSNVWICEIGRNSSLNFGEDLFFLFCFFFFWRSPNFGQKKPLNFGFRTLNFGEDLFFFFWEITQLWAEKSFEFPSFPRHFASSFGQTVWNWFKINENSSQGRLHTSHSFKIAPPPPFPNPGYAPANNNGIHKLQSLVPVIATVKSWALLMASVGESVSISAKEMVSDSSKKRRVKV